jgi:hypothetical protein
MVLKPDKQNFVLVVNQVVILVTRLCFLEKKCENSGKLGSADHHVKWVGKLLL